MTNLLVWSVLLFPTRVCWNGFDGITGTCKVKNKGYNKILFSLIHCKIFIFSKDV